MRRGGHVAIANWGRAEDNELMTVHGGGAATPAARRPPTMRPGPRRWRARHAQGLAHEAGLTVRRVEMVDVPFEAPDQQTLVRALRAPGGRSAVRSITRAWRRCARRSSRPRRRFVSPDGSYAFRNRFTYLVADAGRRVVKTPET